MLILTNEYNDFINSGKDLNKKYLVNFLTDEFKKSVNEIDLSKYSFDEHYFISKHYGTSDNSKIFRFTENNYAGILLERDKEIFDKFLQTSYKYDLYEAYGIPFYLKNFIHLEFNIVTLDTFNIPPRPGFSTDTLAIHIINLQGNNFLELYNSKNKDEFLKSFKSKDLKDFKKIAGDLNKETLFSKMFNDDKIFVGINGISETVKTKFLFIVYKINRDKSKFKVGWKNGREIYDFKKVNN